MAAPAVRPAFNPSLYNPAEAPDSECPPLESANDDEPQSWTPLLSCPADFSQELFETAVAQLIHHPEYNSTLILRSETVAESTDDFPPPIPALKHLRPHNNVHRRLLPRRPGRDGALEQHCTLFADGDRDGALPCALVLTPLAAPGALLPYYHPAVAHLAFRYLPGTRADGAGARLRIEAVPLPGTALGPDGRLARTARALLDTLHRYGWGARTQYRKRVQHDCVVPREAYQDLYLAMRARHKHLVATWQEVTDPLKHVFEDIGIATFLMLLWKDMYRAAPGEGAAEPEPPLDSEPWRHWPQPPAGFVDLGCGNGLLTHILTAEGYRGHGIDVRARTSWAHYPAATQAQLHVAALDPTRIGAGDVDADADAHLGPGVFLIGNHADELTPWVPVLATLCGASGYLSIPCCAWTFDVKFERSRAAPFWGAGEKEEFVAGLNLGGEGAHGSSYSMYRIWLASLSAHCGWKVECETLRIPSTRNWAIVGREWTRGGEDGDGNSRRNAEAIVEGVRGRGLFKTRRPEGKAGDH